MVIVFIAKHNHISYYIVIQFYKKPNGGWCLDQFCKYMPAIWFNIDFDATGKVVHKQNKKPTNHSVSSPFQRYFREILIYFLRIIYVYYLMFENVKNISKTIAKLEKNILQFNKSRNLLFRQSRIY